MSHDLVTIQEIWNPETGELVPAADVDKVSSALKALRRFKNQVTDAIADATVILVEESRRQGTKTLRFSEVEATIHGGPTDDYDMTRLRTELEAAGCPEERISDAIKATVTYKVDRRVLKQLAAANPDYAAAIDLARSTVEKPYYIKVTEGMIF